MRTLVALFAAAACMSAVAGAPSGNDDDKSMKDADTKFEKLDRNKDRQLSKSEAQEDESLAAEFASVDQDADGYVSKMEYSARLQSGESQESSMPEERDPY